MSHELIMQFAVIAASGAGVYAAIRSDLTLAKAKAEQAIKEAEKAHERLDSHIENHH